MIRKRASDEHDGPPDEVLGRGLGLVSLELSCRGRERRIVNRHDDDGRRRTPKVGCGLCVAVQLHHIGVDALTERARANVRRTRRIPHRIFDARCIDVVERGDARLRGVVLGLVRDRSSTRAYLGFARGNGGIDVRAREGCCVRKDGIADFVRARGGDRIGVNRIGHQVHRIAGLRHVIDVARLELNEDHARITGRACHLDARAVIALAVRRGEGGRDGEPIRALANLGNGGRRARAVVGVTNGDGERTGREARARGSVTIPNGERYDVVFAYLALTDAHF